MSAGSTNVLPRPARRAALLGGLGLLGFTAGRALAARDAAVLWDAAERLAMRLDCHTPGGGLLPVSLPPRQPGELRYQGTHILTLGAFRALAAAYDGPGDLHLRVWGGGCDDGIATVVQGSADLGGLCCPVAQTQARHMPWLLVAHDIKAVVTHPDNPATAVEMDALRAVARGQVTRWSVLGGDDRRIALVARKHCPDYFEPVRGLLLNNRPDWAPQALYVDRDEQITDLVARYPGALGLVSWVFAGPLVRAGRLKAMTVDGAPPTAAAVRAGRYPLHGPLSVVFRRWEAERMRPFFDFLYGPAGAALMGQWLLPVTPEEADYPPSRWT